MNLSVGILIIGSLYWDECKGRGNWRRERLLLCDSTPVCVPIRYGRKSISRGCTYTMVFSGALSQDVQKLGCGIAVPCRKRVLSAGDLVGEAEHLWEAENGQFNGKLSANWGCISLLVNPKADVPDELLEEWDIRVKGELGYGKLKHAQDEKPIVDQQGLLKIPWPEPCAGGELALDLLLATATDPTLRNKSYPTAEEIAQAWKEDTGEKVEYFLKNRESGISTFQDEAIQEHLDE
jgi:hypothetical protein